VNAAPITLTVLGKKGEEKRFTFDQPTVCVIGRAGDCDIVLDGLEHLDVSRYHCQLEFDPPAARVRDLGSRNGTFVNGVKIGQRRTWERPWEVQRDDYAAHDLSDGDELQIGSMTFRVSLGVPADAALTPL
jgi:pSer/pThr/pTyr-binding forkhead associated (FHA) protein